MNLNLTLIINLNLTLTINLSLNLTLILTLNMILNLNLTLINKLDSSQTVLLPFVVNQEGIRKGGNNFVPENPNLCPLVMTEESNDGLITVVAWFSQSPQLAIHKNSALQPKKENETDCSVTYRHYLISIACTANSTSESITTLQSIFHNVVSLVISNNENK